MFVLPFHSANKLASALVNVSVGEFVPRNAWKGTECRIAMIPRRP